MHVCRDFLVHVQTGKRSGEPLPQNPLATTRSSGRNRGAMSFENALHCEYGVHVATFGQQPNASAMHLIGLGVSAFESCKCRNPRAF